MAKFKPITEGTLELPDPALLKMVVYDGAHVEYEAIRNAILDLPWEGVVRDSTRAALLEHLGSSKIVNEHGVITEAIVMGGYFTTPEGRVVPAALAARTINVGTNLHKPTRFIDKAVRACRRDAEEAMKNTGEEILRRSTGGK